MKKLFILFAFILTSVMVQAQAIKTYETNIGDVKTIYCVLDTMPTATGSYYSKVIPSADYLNLNTYQNPFTFTLKTAGTACSLYVILQGRASGGGISSDWVDIDTVGTIAQVAAKNQVTIPVDARNTKYPEWRIHVGGITNNNANSVVKLWISLDKRGYRLFKN